MSKFKVGDRLTSKTDNGYSQTGEKCVVVVTKTNGHYMDVKVIKPGVDGHSGSIGKTYSVECSRFTLLIEMEENE